MGTWKTHCGRADRLKTRETDPDRDIHRYYSLLGDELWTIHLSEPEAAAVVDAMRDARADVTWCEHLWKHVADNLRVETHGLDDPMELTAKLRELGSAQTMALVDGVERYWDGAPDPHQFDREELKAVGLIKPWA